jgi:P-type Mg2+ transporter
MILLFLSLFKSPIILILMAAAILSGFLRDVIDAVIILGIVLLSELLGISQERGAMDAVAKLLALVQVIATVLRNGQPQDIPSILSCAGYWANASAFACDRGQSVAQLPD